MDKICILNFNHTYENQDFYKNKEYEIIDLYDLKSVSRYCDEISLDIIRKKLKEFDDAKINFIDSGNYHYISYLLLEKITEPFVLVLFDHHTDMQPSFFANLMSCGCWVKKALVEDKYKDKIICFSEEFIKEKYDWEEFSKKHIKNPIYISIDKDVITPKEAKTDWDQGDLTLEELKNIYSNICKNHEILGIDICGDSSNNSEIFKIDYNNEINNRSNKKILEIIEKEEDSYELSTF